MVNVRLLTTAIIMLTVLSMVKLVTRITNGSEQRDNVEYKNRLLAKSVNSVYPNTVTELHTK